MADEPFPGEEQRFVTTDPPDAILQARRERHDVSRVHGVRAVHINRDHPAKRIEPEIALPRALDEEQRFAREKSFHESLPLRLDGDGGTRRDICRVLQKNRVVLQIDVIQIAGRTGRDADFARAALRGELVDEKRFTRDQTPQTATHLGLHAQVGVHRRHRGRFHLDGLLGLQAHGQKAEVRLGGDAIFVFGGLLIHGVPFQRDRSFEPIANPKLGALCD